jgi:hypothetical protein
MKCKTCPSTLINKLSSFLYAFSSDTRYTLEILGPHEWEVMGKDSSELEKDIYETWTSILKAAIWTEIASS